MAIYVTDSSVLPPAQLFKRTRHALGMSVEEMQNALCVINKNTLMRMERGAASIGGSTWVALRFLLGEALGRHPRDTEFQAKIADLARQVEQYMEAIRRAAAERRGEIARQRDARQSREEQGCS